MSYKAIKGVEQMKFIQAFQRENNNYVNGVIDHSKTYLPL